MKNSETNHDRHIRPVWPFVFVFLMMTLFAQVTTGNAQEPTPSALAEGTETPTFTVEPTATETGTATPDSEAAVPLSTEPEEASLEGPFTRVLVTVSSMARIGNVSKRADPYGVVVESDELAKLGVFIIDVPTATLNESMVELRNTTGVTSVELDYPVYAADTIPNDPGFGSQYALASIRAPQGWDLSTGSGTVTIAILDTGVDFGHADLVDKLVAGYDFVNNDPFPLDDNGHGTHVAGIAAASGNNGIGIAGVSWGAKIMPVKVLNTLNSGSYSNVAAGIVWAVDHGAQVINMSLGGTGDPDAITNPSALRLAVLYAYDHNVLMVASAGNTGSNSVLYPARYPEVMAVGASNASNLPTGFTNYGPEVDVAAPGENIYSTFPGGYVYQSGTSMATPHVSGLAAILYGYLSSAASVRDVIESTALDIGPTGWDPYSGAGLIQMDAALARVLLPTSSGGGGVSPGGYGPGPALPLIPPTWTASPLPALVPVTPTQTFPSPMPEVHNEVQAALSSLTPTPTNVPSSGPKGRWSPLLSPYFCTGLLMILLGVLLFLWQKGRETKTR